MEEMYRARCGERILSSLELSRHVTLPVTAMCVFLVCQLIHEKDTPCKKYFKELFPKQSIPFYHYSVVLFLAKDT